MFVVTFYSYKGGVGRTLALVNTAFRLAARGKSVFVLDFDLEAPGIDAFNLWSDGQPHQGIVEYISRFTADGKVESLDNYVTTIDQRETSPGKIYFMGAGRKDNNYRFQLSTLDWKQFYSQQNGFLFVENLKAAIEQTYTPDYVLIDSRTGLTDISGICTLQMPNLVVLMFNLNNQNVEGISQIYRSIRFNKLSRDIGTLLVASPIPDVPDFVGIRKGRLEYARKKIGAQDIDLILPFDAFVAFEEVVLKESRSSTYLAKSYDVLCNKVIGANKADPTTILENADHLAEQGDVAMADLLYQELIEVSPNNHEVYSEYGRFLRIQGKKKTALKYFRKAHQLSPEDPEAFSDLLTMQMSMGRIKEALLAVDQFLSIAKDGDDAQEIGDALERKGALEHALRAYERALEISPSDPSEIHFSMGNIYMRMQDPKNAQKHYELVVEAAPTMLAAVFNYGRALQLSGDAEALHYLEKAVELFERQGPADTSATYRANSYQAMSYAYLAVGQKGKSRELLNNAIRVARKMPLRRPVFSVVKYQEISAREFVQETKRLLKTIPM
jgi:tetratricopeptide (TPR) repeat protein